MGYRPSAAFAVSTRTLTGTGDTPGEPLGLTPVIGLWPGHSGPISSRVIGARVFSGASLSAGVACLNAQYRRLTVPTTDIRPGYRRRLIGRAYRSTRA